MRYPELGEELMAMLASDQREVRECSRAYKRAPQAATTYEIRDRFIVRAQERIKRVFEILDEIQYPTIDNVGEAASQAISVLALHARVSDMRKVLALYEESFKKDHNSVYYEAIPSLTDRILVVERHKQRFGTQWMFGADGKFFLPPVEDFEHLNERRAVHSLGKSRHPIDLTDGVPEHDPPRPDTQKSDQREPTKQEYDDFVYGSLD